MRKIARLIIHHSGTPPATTLESIRHQHVVVNGWDGIGYHAVITGDGVLHRTRRFELPGIHDSGENADSIGLCITGDNTRKGMGWNAAQMQTAACFIALCRALIPNLVVEGHRDRGPQAGIPDRTLCPGLEVSQVFPPEV